MNSPLTHIYLYGDLGKEFGNHWELAVHSPAEAVRALARLRPGFIEAIQRLDAVVEGFEVDVGDKSIPEEMLSFPANGQTITITPIVQGTDTKGIIQIVAGVALIAIGLVLSPWGGGVAGFIGMQLVGLGAAVALGGVSRLLMSTPNMDSADETKQRASYLFSGVVNTAGQGGCVPVLFGEMFIGSAVVSSAVESFDKLVGGGLGGPTVIGQQPGDDND